MRRPITATIALLGSLALFGAGCADQPSPLDGIGASVGALNEAKELTAEEAARKRRGDDVMTVDISVATIITEGSDVPPAVTRVEPGTIGCNDRVGYVRVFRETDYGDVAWDALASLLANRESTIEQTYNSTWQSSLVVESVRPTSDGPIEVRLTGLPLSGGTCDDPRIKAQVEYTVSQYWPDYRILLNGSESAWRCIGDMSGLCK